MSRYVPPGGRTPFSPSLTPMPPVPSAQGGLSTSSFRRSAAPASSEEFPSLGKKPLPASSEDFPSLGKKPLPASLGGRTPPLASLTPVPSSSSASPASSASSAAPASTAVLTNRYADLARSWGIQKKEEEEKTKKAEKDSVLQARLLREKEEKERRFFRISATNATALLNRQAVDDIPLEDDRVVIDDYESGEEVVEEEESESGYDAEELDAGWNQRRHKNELY